MEKKNHIKINLEFYASIHSGKTGGKTANCFFIDNNWVKKKIRKSTTIDLSKKAINLLITI